MDNRRNFIKKVIAAGTLASVGVSLPLTLPAAPQKGRASLNLSFQEGIAPGKSLNEKFDYMEKLGIVGFEPGGGGLANRVSEIKQALNGRNIKVSAICAGFSGWLIAEDPEKRRQCMESTKEILAAGSELGSVGMILVPGFNGQQPSLQMPGAREILLEQLRELAEYARQRNTAVILEPLNRGEAWFLRLLADAAAMCREVDSPGLTCLGDFWHMTREETSDRGAFISAGKYLGYVHMASRKRRSMPGEDGEADNYIDGFKGLKEIGYQGYVSFECGTKGKREETVPAAVKLLREQWKRA
ncbi:MAG: sugar phosphate isomerase/epimerase [Prevotellaceae bacterium]|jgi:sugar phosphate isomerase/epimerase|nr:sugar phosphate isomerase/epimerase [Prevotellaceae bacterium]